MFVRHYSRRLGNPEVELREIRRFIVDSLQAVDVSLKDAKAHADLLLHADKVGYHCLGVNRLPLYVKEIKSKGTIPSAKPCILNESDATAWVDGCNALGSTIGHFCMDIAIKKAIDVGAGWVSAKRCNHYGMASYWGLRAEEHGLIGLSFTNTLPIMVPTRAKHRALGANPISLVAPAACDEKIIVDLATTAIAIAKLRLAAQNDDKLVPGVALGYDFKPTTDPKEALKAGLLMPLGGEEKSSGYKGYGLAAMVEIFCSGLAGSFTEHHCRKWNPEGGLGPPDLGQCYVAIDPCCFAPDFENRVTECLKTWRKLDPVDPALPVLAPGDKERIIGKKTKSKGVVTFTKKRLDRLIKLAKELGVKPLRVNKC